MARRATGQPVGRPGVTREEVQEACGRLIAEGRSISLKTVCAELGRGSRSTVSAHLKSLGYLGRNII
jgi:hypothetical protein